jgi:hypothetical protein
VFPSAAELARLTELSRVKRKELQQLVEEMLAVAPDFKKGLANAVGKGHQDLMGKIMGTDEDDTKEVKKGIRERIKEEDFEDDGFDEWRQDILRRAVAEGFTKYSKHLVN